MKAELDSLTMKEEKQILDINGRKACNAIDIWNDNMLSDSYLADTLGVAVKQCYLTRGGKIDEEEDDIEFYSIWLTKSQCIVLKNYLDSFIQLAETEEELAEKL